MSSLAEARPSGEDRGGKSGRRTWYELRISIYLSIYLYINLYSAPIKVTTQRCSQNNGGEQPIFCHVNQIVESLTVGQEVA